MTFLLVCKQKKNIDTFEGVVAALLSMGHRVILTVQEPDAARDVRLAEQFAHENFSVVPCPDGSHDHWRRTAQLLRTARDWAQYTKPAYRTASKLAARTADRLARELGAASVSPASPLPSPAAARVDAAFAHLERAVPRDPLLDEFLTTLAPDVVLVTPGLHFGSGQADVMKSARALGLPVWMLLFSWDNLSTKGALHVHPDLLFVWNERQRREAGDLHGFPAEDVVVAGAPRFDAFFELRTQMPRGDFLGPLGLDRARPTLLYLCSSRFIAEDEPAFIRSWLTAVRQAGGPLAGCNVIVRPHPDVPFESPGHTTTVQWPAMPLATGWMHRPFDDATALVLRTTYGTPQAFFECLHHADAVVALNTSAEFEAGIAGRPVFTVLADDRAADGQAQTLHFNYLLREQGGFVSFAGNLAEHVGQLQAALREPPAHGAIERFVHEFLRPHGDQPVAPLLARLLVERASSTARGAVSDAPADRHQLDGAVIAGREGGPAADAATRRLRLAPDSAAAILATPETKRWRRDGVYLMAPSARGWLESAVRPGDTVYDIGAGVGAYAIFAAMHRGCTVVAFEPGFAAFKSLCDNVVHNHCQGRVAALPIALGARPGLFELEYAHESGDDQHTLSARAWRPHGDGADPRRQAVCADTLDQVVSRHALPPPAAIRISVRRHAPQVLSGAAHVLALPGVRAILCSLRSAEQAREVANSLKPLGFSADPLIDDGDHGMALRLTRTGLPPSRKLRRNRLWEGLSRARQG